ncbi:SPOR domain-containing protein [uncultured Salinisphaera sp.]|uniref:SPOR domain-containing protein n=1 Tax=uncultured Salinisphaera sp. TaxID=359372 RepID=UPI0032B1132E|tara:strand:- start:289 stop:1020 length:732 start_codon:yes stop_codon:yes gene_type:complete
MARDYSGRPGSSSSNNGKRKPTRRQPAARPTPTKRTKGGGPPGWVWMICGLCIGLTVAAVFYVFARPGGDLAREQIKIAMPEKSSKDESSQSAKAAAPAEPEAEEEEPRFSFYKMLPNYEVVIPEEEYPEKKSRSASHSAPPSAAEVEQPASNKPQPTTPKVEEPGRFIIQAGSFSTPADAERRKAELGMLGLAAKTVEVDLPSGKTVYRVQSNTISSSSELNKILKRLRENRIDTLVMRAKN